VQRLGCDTGVDHGKLRGGAATVGHREDEIFQRPIPERRHNAGRHKHDTHRQIDSRVMAGQLLSQLGQLRKRRVVAAARMGSSGDR
jgi:hypothetical protein